MLLRRLLLRLLLLRRWLVIGTTATNQQNIQLQARYGHRPLGLLWRCVRVAVVCVANFEALHALGLRYHRHIRLRRLHRHCRAQTWAHGQSALLRRRQHTGSGFGLRGQGRGDDSIEPSSAFPSQTPHHADALTASHTHERRLLMRPLPVAHCPVNEHVTMVRCPLETAPRCCRRLLPLQWWLHCCSCGRLR